MSRSALPKHSAFLRASALSPAGQSRNAEATFQQTPEEPKLLVPKAPIAGQTDFSKPVGFYYDGNTRIAKPGECCTESWVVAGAFSTKTETESFKSYLFTKVVRFLILQSVISQDVTRQHYKFVPDLGKYEGVYTDAQLCKRWGISAADWKFIDSRILAVTEINAKANKA